MSDSLEFRALGPLTVLRADVPVELGKGHERALVALLILFAGRPVSTDRICNALWNEEQPPTAREMVRNYVARVRRRLGDGSITTLPTGYRLEAGVEMVDLLRFQRLGDEGARVLETGNSEGALRSFDEALALWRGPPLLELDLAVGRDEIARLEELRLEIVENRAEAELALGRSGVLVPELEQLLREHPDRERMRGQLMLALYRSGRQRDALDCYRTGRDRLVEDAGLEPGPELRQLQLAILRHDPALEAPRINGTHAHQRADHPRAIPRGATIGVASAVLIAAAVGIHSLLAGGPSPIVLTSRSLGVLDPRSGAVVGSAKLNSSPGPLTVGQTGIWVASHARDAVVAIDPTTLRTEREIPLAIIPFSIAAGGGSVWVGNGFLGTVTRIDRRGLASRPFRPEPTSTGRLALAYGFGSLWSGSQDGTITRLDPVTRRPVALIRDVGKPQAIAVGADGVWVTESTRDAIVRIDPRTNRVVRAIPIGGEATGIATTDNAVWAVTSGDGRLWRIDPRTNAVTASIDVGANPTSVATSSGSVWVSSPGGILARIDPATNRIIQTVALNRPIDSISGGSTRLFVTLP